MKFPYLSLHIVAFALSLDGLHAYKIDTVSCGNPGDSIAHPLPPTEPAD